jgi:hypothetical protein
MLERHEEYMLAKRWRDHGDRDAAHKLVNSHLRLVTKIARDYRGYGLPISEAISEGNVGLMKAVADGIGSHPDDRSIQADSRNPGFALQGESNAGSGKPSPAATGQCASPTNAEATAP